MADSERSRTDGSGTDKPAKKRDDLDQLLRRIAAHIAEADRGESPDGDEASHGGHAGHAVAAEPGSAGTGAAATASRPEIAAGQGAAAAQRDTAPASVDDEQALEPIVNLTPPKAATVAEAPPIVEARGAIPRSGPSASDFIQTAEASREDDADGLLTAPTPVSNRRAPSIEPPALRSALPGNGKPPAEVTVRRPRDADPDEPAPSQPLATPARAAKDPKPDVAPIAAAAAARVSTPSTDAAAVAVQAPAAGSWAAAATDEPWDRDAAEALTRTYEEDAEVPPLRNMLNLMSGASRPSSSGISGGGGSGGGLPAMPAPGANPAEVAASAVGVEPSHGKLLDAARRVEAMLDQLASRAAVETLGERFGALESEVGRTGAQLGRLDGIESRLAELGAKLSEEHVVALFGSLVPTAEELTHFAEDAAGRAAERVLEAYAQELAHHSPARPADEAGTAKQIGALSELLAVFMDDRRRNDAGTLDTLETLQLAMQHVLDRIDQLETGPLPAEAVVEPTAVMPSAEASRPALESSYVMPGHLIGDVEASAPREPEPPMRRPVESRTFPPEIIPEARGYDEAVAVPHQAVREAVPAGNARAPDGDTTDRAEPAPRVPLAPDEEVRAPAPPLSDRQAFIAMARKAAETAKAKADGGANGAADKAAKPRSSRTPMAGAAPAKGVSGIRPGVLIVTSLAAILLAGYWFLAGPKLGLTSASVPAVSEQVEPAERAPATGSQPDMESDEPPAPKQVPGGTTPPAPNRTSDDRPSGPAVQDLQEAKANPVPSDTAGPGISIANASTPASYEQVMQARERARLANLSQRTALTAARSHPVPPGASPIETASVTPAPTAAVAAPAAAVAAPVEANRQLVLPPATTGPLSLRLAAAQGDASAQLEIATRLAEGKGVTQNFTEAVTWYQRAAAQGQAVAQYRLATLYERGMGVKADRAQARSWYERAAEQGNLKAMHNLAVMTASAVGGTPDYATAAQLFTKAAAHGLADSQYNLGVLYESGLGLPKDHAAAYKWYSLAATGGDEDAARRRDLLIARLPPETIQATEAQIAAWRPMRQSEQVNNARVAGDGWKHREAEIRR